MKISKLLIIVFIGCLLLTGCGTTIRATNLGSNKYEITVLYAGFMGASLNDLSLSELWNEKAIKTCGYGKYNVVTRSVGENSMTGIIECK